MKVYKIRNEKNGTACIEKDISAVMCWVEEMYWNSELIISVKEMTEDEYNALPEFTGF